MYKLSLWVVGLYMGIQIVVGIIRLAIN